MPDDNFYDERRAALVRRYGLRWDQYFKAALDDLDEMERRAASGDLFDAPWMKGPSFSRRQKAEMLAMDKLDKLRKVPR
jgi:hypothetical protein